MSFSYFHFSEIFITRLREILYESFPLLCSQENALNVKTIIQELLVSEAERIIDQSAKDNNLLDKNRQLGSDCA